MPPAAMPSCAARLARHLARHRPDRGRTGTPGAGPRIDPLRGSVGGPACTGPDTYMRPSRPRDGRWPRGARCNRPCFRPCTGGAIGPRSADALGAITTATGPAPWRQEGLELHLTGRCGSQGRLSAALPGAAGPHTATRFGSEAAAVALSSLSGGTRTPWRSRGIDTRSAVPCDLPRRGPRVRRRGSGSADRGARASRAG